MKKIFTLLTALVLSLTIANAQVSGNKIKKLSGELVKSPKAGVSGMATLRHSKAQSMPKRIALDSDEHIVGFYETDDLDLTSGIGYPYNPGQLKAGVLFEDGDDIFQKYYGGQITKVRFGLVVAVPVANVEIYEVDPITMDTENAPCVSHTDIPDSASVVGWNDVTLATPVTIEKGKDYIVSFEYTQNSDTSDDASFPLATDLSFNSDVMPDYGCLFYGTWGYPYYTTDWLTLNGYGEDGYYYYYGSFCIQVVVKGGNDVADDIAIKKFNASKYAKAGEEYDYSFNIRSDGNTIPTSYELSVSIDGTVAQTLNTPIALTSEYQTYNGSIVLASDLSTSSHDITIHVEKINGNVPTENTDDDTLESSFTVYEGNVDRQMHLIENLTSVYCTNCPLGHSVIEKMQENNPGKYAWVEIHGTGMGADPYYLSDNTTSNIEYLACPSGYSYPSAVFDRYYFEDYAIEYGALGISIGWSSERLQSSAALMYDDLINSVYDKIPAFAEVNIESIYDAETRGLTIKVSGNGVSNANEFLADNRLMVYLTEDNLISYQDSLGKSVDDYVHNNVLRKMVYDEYTWGDEINWTSDSSYENDYTLTLDDSWNADNMHIIAFISKSFGVHEEGDDETWYLADYDDVYVNNTNMVKLSNSTGIKATISDTNVVEVSRYTTDGRQISSPVKGLNIVKMSDGTARKVIVK